MQLDQNFKKNYKSLIKFGVYRAPEIMIQIISQYRKCSPVSTFDNKKNIEYSSIKTPIN